VRIRCFLSVSVPVLDPVPPSVVEDVVDDVVEDVVGDFVCAPFVPVLAPFPAVVLPLLPPC
jgi:hypothetical protein